MNVTLEKLEELKLPQLIRMYRKDQNISIEELADYTGASKSYIWNLENGRVHNPGLRLCAAISDVLGIPLDDMAYALILGDNE